MTPNDIEIFFETNRIFRERVLLLFKNYRKEWRNKSTHDYKLFFDENEVFIALMSVTSFVHLLLKKIQEKITYQTQQRKLAEEKDNSEKLRSIVLDKGKETIDKLVDIISEFSKQNSQQIFNTTKAEVEIMGLFHAYINSVSKTITVVREPRDVFGQSGRDMRIDFLIEIDDKQLILEFKKSHNKSLNIRHFLVSMLHTNIFQGIIYYANFNEPSPEPKIVKTETILNDKKYEITTITT